MNRGKGGCDKIDRSPLTLDIAHPADQCLRM